MPKASHASRLERLEDRGGVKHAELAESTRTYAAQLAAERAEWAALPRDEKLARRRAELAQLDADFAKATAAEWCGNLYDIRSSQLELEILELAGAPREWCENARDWAWRRLWAHEHGPAFVMKAGGLVLPEPAEETAARYERNRQAALEARKDWGRYRWLLDSAAEQADARELAQEVQRQEPRPRPRPEVKAPEADPIAPYRGRQAPPTEPDPPLFQPGEY